MQLHLLLGVGRKVVFVVIELLLEVLFVLGEPLDPLGEEIIFAFQVSYLLD